MLKRWQLKLAPLACTALLAGCGGSDDANRDRPAQSADAKAATTTTASQVALNGCVEAAPGTNQFVLRQVRFDGQGQSDPHRSTTTSGPHGITEGSWVRLDAPEHGTALLANPGQRVAITGVIVDTGQNTIGTAGTGGNPTTSGDRSQAASSKSDSEKVKQEAGRIGRESMADGTAAMIKVASVKSTGEPCQAGR